MYQKLSGLFNAMMKQSTLGKVNDKCTKQHKYIV